MEHYVEMHYSHFLKSDYFKYRKLFKQVLKYEYNPIVKYEILTIKAGKTEEDVERIKQEIEEQENQQHSNYEEDEGNYYANYYE